VDQAQIGGNGLVGQMQISGLPLQLDEQLTLFYFRSINSQGHIRRSSQNRSVRDLELGVVPGTGENLAFQRTLGQGRASVRASSLQTVELAF
jgi:hypothetical protein